MDVLFDLLKQLKDSMNMGTFALVLLIIALSSVILATYFTRNSNKRTGFWAIFKNDATKDANELREVKDKLGQIITGKAESIARLLETITELRSDGLASKDTIKTQVERSLTLKTDIDAARDVILKSLEDMKYVIRMKDEHAVMVQESINNFLQKLSDQLSSVSSQIDKVDEMAKDLGGEFRGDHKDLTKSLSELSKDVALIERTIQNQINTSGVKLR